MINIFQDDIVEEQIFSYLSVEKKSFLLFAGAGSGKTRSLVIALENLCKQFGLIYSQKAQKIAVITYTNAAKDEIVRRVHHSPVVDVSTIHYFCWKLISEYTYDIKSFLELYISEKLVQLHIEQSKGRIGTKAYDERNAKIQIYTNRKESLVDVARFIYDPLGENLEFNSLQHQEVLQIASTFINEKDTLRKLIVSKYPIILVDECQDTHKILLDSLINLEFEFQQSLVLGLFGDMMQRIYPDGKENLETDLPEYWKKPQKVLNHRSAKRIVELINKIRLAGDTHQQIARSDSHEGFIRFFIADQDSNRAEIESSVAVYMNEITNDSLWVNKGSGLKVLILEHHLASVRDGFPNLFKALNDVESFKTASVDGTLPFLVMLKRRIVPLIIAIENNDEFAIANHIQKNSDLIHFMNANDFYKLAYQTIEQIKGIYNSNLTRLYDLLKILHFSKLFDFTEDIKFLLTNECCSDENNNDYSKELSGLSNALKCGISEAKNYVKYFDKLSSFDTHQGVKGLEYDNVMVILDDREARGFMFSYDKLFGIKDKTPKDLENERLNIDNSISRTNRLFYVTCSRAKKSLAVVAYCSDRNKLKHNLIDFGWVTESEIVMI